MEDDIITSDTAEEAVAAMMGEPVKRRGRPPGSKNKLKGTLSIPPHKITKYVPKDEAGFLEELAVLVEEWRTGYSAEERENAPLKPVLYCFECAAQIGELKAKYGIP